MMKQMRENTKIILWIVVVAFVVTIFAVWGLDLQTGDVGPRNQGIVGRVNGVPVTAQALQSIYSQLAQQYREGQPLTSTQQDLLRDQAWNNIVSNILTQQEIERLGITVSDEEVLGYLRSSPPHEVRRYFVDEAGNFDYAAYQAALNNPDADWTSVEALARQRIPVLKLNQYLSAQVHVGVDEVRRVWEEENTRMVAEYVAFPIDEEEARDYAPSDEEILSYYEAHTDDFSYPERAAIDYIRFPIEPTEQDRDDVLAVIGIIEEGINAGDEFGEMARIYSEGPTADDGGDIGFIGGGARDTAVVAALAELEPGDVSAPVITKAGVYLLKLIAERDQNGEKEHHAAEIFIGLDASSQTLDSLVTFAQEVQRRAAEVGLEVAAQESGLAVVTAPPFERDSFIDGLGFVPAITRFAFANEPAALSGVIGDDENYYVCRVAERTPEGVRPLEEVRDVVVESVVEEYRSERVRRRAEGLYLRLRTQNIELDVAAADYGRAVLTTDTFSVSTAVGDAIPPSSPFQLAALSAPVDELTRPIKAVRVWYVIRVTYRSDFDPDRFIADQTVIHDRLLNRKTQEYVTWWYGNLRDNSKIEDFRGTL